MATALSWGTRTQIASGTAYSYALPSSQPFTFRIYVTAVQNERSAKLTYEYTVSCTGSDYAQYSGPYWEFYINGTKVATAHQTYMNQNTTYTLSTGFINVEADAAGYFPNTTFQGKWIRDGSSGYPPKDCNISGEVSLPYIGAIKESEQFLYWDGSEWVNLFGLQADYIIEQGTANSASGGSSTLTWSYRKWNSGIAECWARASWSTTSFSLWTNGVYQGGQRPWWNFPSGMFVSTPFLQALHCTDGGTWFQDVITDGGTKTVSATNTCAFCCLRPSNYAPVPVTTHLYAKGNWK